MTISSTPWCRNPAAANRVHPFQVRIRALFRSGGTQTQQEGHNPSWPHRNVASKVTSAFGEGRKGEAIVNGIDDGERWNLSRASLAGESPKAHADSGSSSLKGVEGQVLSSAPARNLTRSLLSSR